MHDSNCSIVKAYESRTNKKGSPKLHIFTLTFILSSQFQLNHTFNSHIHLLGFHHVRKKHT